MIYFFIFLTVIIWLNVGILAYKSTEDTGSDPLEAMALPLRLAVILLAPIGVLIFERHLFYSKAEPEEILIDKE